MADLVLKPTGMGHSTFAQPLPADLIGDAAGGADGKNLPGGYHVFPEQCGGGPVVDPHRPRHATAGDRPRLARREPPVP